MICNRKDNYLERTNTLRMFQRMKTVSFQIDAFPKNSFEFLAADFVQINEWRMARVSINQPINCTFGLTVNLIKMPQGYPGGSVIFPRGSGVQLYPLEGSGVQL